MISQLLIGGPPFSATTVTLSVTGAQGFAESGTKPIPITRQRNDRASQQRPLKVGSIASRCDSKRNSTHRSRLRARQDQVEVAQTPFVIDPNAFKVHFWGDEQWTMSPSMSPTMSPTMFGSPSRTAATVLGVMGNPTPMNARFEFEHAKKATETGTARVVLEAALAHNEMHTDSATSITGMDIEDSFSPNFEPIPFPTRRPADRFLLGRKPKSATTFRPQPIYVEEEFDLNTLEEVNKAILKKQRKSGLPRSREKHCSQSVRPKHPGTPATSQGYQLPPFVVSASKMYAAIKRGCSASDLSPEAERLCLAMSENEVIAHWRKHLSSERSSLNRLLRKKGKAQVPYFDEQLQCWLISKMPLIEASCVQSKEGSISKPSKSDNKGDPRKTGSKKSLAMTGKLLTKTEALRMALDASKSRSVDLGDSTKIEKFIDAIFSEIDSKTKKSSSSTKKSSSLTLKSSSTTASTKTLDASAKKSGD